MTDIHDAVDAAFAEQLELIETLVNQPSHTFAPDDVEAAGDLLDEAAAAMGLGVRHFDSYDQRFARHRMYSTPAAGDRELAIGLIGHVDTVFPRSSGFLTFSKDDEVARGPGVLDMKSGLSMALFALRAVRDVDADAYGRLAARFICVSDEEVGSPSGRHVYDQVASGLSEALVLEMGRDEDRIVTSRKGGGTFHLGAMGKAAHAGNAHSDGANAIHALALKIPELEALTDYDRGVTINVGLIEGGTSKNTVPDHASCTIDVRCVTAADVQQTVDAMLAIASSGTPEGASASLRGTKYALTGAITRPPMEATPEAQALRLRYEPHAAAVGLSIGEAPRQGGFSDANLLAAHGVPTIDGLGAFGKGAHRTTEWLDLLSLRRRTKALATYLREMAGR